MSDQFYDAQQVRLDVARALSEDVGSGDLSAALLPEDQHVVAVIMTREWMVMAGQPWVNEVLNQVDAELEIQWLVHEGECVSANQNLCYLRGPSRSLVTAERTALNFLQTLAATATKTYRYVEALQAYPTKILDTRKTLPGLRYAQKYAVRCGGGHNHRMGLYDAYLIKENHIQAAGSIHQALERARQLAPHAFLEIEVENIQQLKQALLLQPDRILLDNFALSDLKHAVDLAREHACPVEASGGVNLQTLEAIAQTGVDFISIGDLTKSVQAIDLSLRVLNNNPS